MSNTVSVNVVFHKGEHPGTDETEPRKHDYDGSVRTQDLQVREASRTGGRTGLGGQLAHQG